MMRKLESKEQIITEKRFDERYDHSFSRNVSTLVIHQIPRQNAVQNALFNVRAGQSSPKRIDQRPGIVASTSTEDERGVNTVLIH